MKYIFMMLPIAAIWLLSANEQGLVGSWAVWTSIGIILFFVAMMKLSDMVSSAGACAEEIFAKIKDASAVRAHKPEANKKIA